MLGFETTSVTVAHRHRGEDRVKIIDRDGGVVIIVADGAGGSGSGGEAADTVVREVAAFATLDRGADGWCEILNQTDLRVASGESTCVVAAWSANGIVGASVGDSEAWLIEGEKLCDLTSAQSRKPLLGSGEARPVGFSHPPSQGLLLASTDGFSKYVRREALMRELPWIEFPVLVRKLVDLVRLPSGDLWDDVGLVACRPRRQRRSRQ